MVSSNYRLPSLMFSILLSLLFSYFSFIYFFFYPMSAPCPFPYTHSALGTYIPIISLLHCDFAASVASCMEPDLAFKGPGGKNPGATFPDILGPSTYSSPHQITGSHLPQVLTMHGPCKFSMLGRHWVGRKKERGHVTCWVCWVPAADLRVKIDKIKA